MAPVFFKVLLRLSPKDDGGRPLPLGRLSMVSCDVGGTFRGQPVCFDARVLLETQGTLKPGEECSARLDPLSPELWDGVQQGQTFMLMVGRRLMGEGVILERISGMVQ
jgi:hypothetical protein